MCGVCRNGYPGNWLQEVMTETKESHKVGIWKNNNSENRTQWAIYRAIKLHHPIKLNNPLKVSMGRWKTTEQFWPSSDGSSQWLGPSLVLKHTPDNGLCSQGWPHSNKSRLDRVAPCLLSKVPLKHILERFSLKWEQGEVGKSHGHGFKLSSSTPLVAQWLRILQPMQRTRVRSLVREDCTCHWTTTPTYHNHWARLLQLLKPTHPRAHALQ